MPSKKSLKKQLAEVKAHNKVLRKDNSKLQANLRKSIQDGCDLSEELNKIADLLHPLMPYSDHL